MITMKKGVLFVLSIIFISIQCYSQNTFKYNHISVVNKDFEEVNNLNVKGTINLKKVAQKDIVSLDIGGNTYTCYSQKTEIEDEAIYKRVFYIGTIACEQERLEGFGMIGFIYNKRISSKIPEFISYYVEGSESSLIFSIVD